MGRRVDREQADDREPDHRGDQDRVHAAERPALADVHPSGGGEIHQSVPSTSTNWEKPSP